MISVFGSLLYLQDVSATTLNGLTSVRLISLVSNCLRTLPTGFFSSSTLLEVLDLRYNQLQHINMQTLNQLHLLDLSHNPLTSVSNMKLGHNHHGAVFAFKNTSIKNIHYCYEEFLPKTTRTQRNIKESRFATIYIGTAHTISCSCEILALEDLIRGNKCIVSTADLLRFQKCQDDKNLLDLYQCPRQKHYP